MKTGMSIMKENIENFGGKADKQKQYSLHDCLLLHSVVENEGENIDDLVLNIVNEKMNIEPPSSDWDRTHRIGWKKESYRKLRAVIVKFISYNTRKQIFSKKKQLKSTGTSITEKRMSKRMGMLKEAIMKLYFTNVWAANGEIPYKHLNNNKILLYNFND